MVRAEVDLRNQVFERNSSSPNMPLIVGGWRFEEEFNELMAKIGLGFND